MGRLHVKALLQHLHQDREKFPALRRLDLELGALLCASLEHGDCQRVDWAIHVQSAFARFHRVLELQGRSGVAEGPAKALEKFPKTVARQILQDAQARNVHPIWAQSGELEAWHCPDLAGVMLSSGCGCPEVWRGDHRAPPCCTTGEVEAVVVLGECRAANPAHPPSATVAPPPRKAQH